MTKKIDEAWEGWDRAKAFMRRNFGSKGTRAKQSYDDFAKNRERKYQNKPNMSVKQKVAKLGYEKNQNRPDGTTGGTQLDRSGPRSTLAARGGNRLAKQSRTAGRDQDPAKGTTGAYKQGMSLDQFRKRSQNGPNKERLARAIQGTKKVANPTVTQPESPAQRQLTTGEKRKRARHSGTPTQLATALQSNPPKIDSKARKDARSPTASPTALVKATQGKPPEIDGIRRRLARNMGAGSSDPKIQSAAAVKRASLKPNAKTSQLQSLQRAKAGAAQAASAGTSSVPKPRSKPSSIVAQGTSNQSAAAAGAKFAPKPKITTGPAQANLAARKARRARVAALGSGSSTHTKTKYNFKGGFGQTAVSAAQISKPSAAQRAAGRKKLFEELILDIIEANETEPLKGKVADKVKKNKKNTDIGGKTDYIETDPKKPVMFGQQYR